MLMEKKSVWAFLPIGLAIFTVGFLSGNLTNSCKASDCKNLEANVLDSIASKAEVGEKVTYYLGDENAPIEMIEYTDYQCPFCQKYFFGSFPLIKETFIATGKVKYTVKDLALSFHPKARPASYTTRCAGEQDKYWEMHEKIYIYQNQWSYADNYVELFEKYAQEIDLDINEFKSCYASAPAKFDKYIDEDIREASMKGISGTPSFSINGTIIIGAQPFEKFSQAINKQ